MELAEAEARLGSILSHALVPFADDAIAASPVGSADDIGSAGEAGSWGVGRGSRAVTITSRIKSARSVFEKTTLRGKVLDDLLALRVVVEPSADDVAEATCIARMRAVQALVEALWVDLVTRFVATKCPVNLPVS